MVSLMAVGVVGCKQGQITKQLGSGGGSCVKATEEGECLT
jgi:hypothetical protein